MSKHGDSPVRRKRNRSLENEKEEVSRIRRKVPVGTTSDDGTGPGDGPSDGPVGGTRPQGESSAGPAGAAERDEGMATPPRMEVSAYWPILWLLIPLAAVILWEFFAAG